MKIPLSYQMTEYDCGPTSVLNAISFLFERDEIPPDVVKYITMYTLDTYNSKGEHGKSGTSQMAMMFLSNWINQLGKAKKLPVSSQYLSGEEVKISPHSIIIGALQQGGAVVFRLLYGCGHYVLLTGVHGETIELFDPYYRKRPFKEKDIEMIWDCPTTKNRKVSFKQMNSTNKKTPYALGNLAEREAVILFNTDTKKAAEAAIEYYL
ncbi:peptidase C39 [Clostridia bacterium]|nr:peptidase C39 [Clostridia bacterium]